MGNLLENLFLIVFLTRRSCALPSNQELILPSALKLKKFSQFELDQVVDVGISANAAVTDAGDARSAARSDDDSLPNGKASVKEVVIDGPLTRGRHLVLVAAALPLPCPPMSFFIFPCCGFLISSPGKRSSAHAGLDSGLAVRVARLLLPLGREAAAWIRA